MKELTGDLWSFQETGAWCAITTNGYVKGDGRCVMGRGVAKEAADRFPEIPRELGSAILTGGNHVHFLSHNLISFPVKHQWFERADMALIKRSAIELVRHATVLRLDAVYLVRPGCGNGHLDWASVKACIEKILDDDRFIVVQR